MAQPARAFEHVVPLGGYCETAYNLKRIGVRREAYPYDSAYCNLEALFDDLLNVHTADEFVARRIAQRHAPPSAPVIVCAHEDLNDPIQVETLRRRAARLLALFEQPNTSILFVRKCNQWDTGMGNLGDDQCQRLLWLLRTRCHPTTRVGLAIINCPPEGHAPAATQAPEVVFRSNDDPGTGDDDLDITVMDLAELGRAALRHSVLWRTEFPRAEQWTGHEACWRALMQELEML
jgi:hypothetical protein